MIVQEILTSFKLIVDSLEQPIDRPSDNEEQKKIFSGKKKQHTRKSQVVSLPEGKDIIDIKVGFPGPTADINLFRNKFYLMSSKHLKEIKDTKVVKILQLLIREKGNKN